MKAPMHLESIEQKESVKATIFLTVGIICLL